MMKNPHYLQDLDVFSCDVDKVYTESYHQGWPELFSVQFLWRGRMVFGIDNGPRRTLQAPALYWIEPEHRYYLSGVDGTDRRHFVLFRGIRGRQLMVQGFHCLHPDGWMQVDRAGEMDAAFRALAKVLRTAEPSAALEGGLLLERIYGLLVTTSGRPQGPTAAAIAEVAERLRQDPCAEHDLTTLAAEVGMSYSHFRACFRDQIGRPPYDYLLHCRMQTAAAALHQSDRQIKAVATDLGFTDPAQFSRAFRRHFGISPTTYRQLVGGFKAPASPTE